MLLILLFNFIASAVATSVLVSETLERRTMGQIYQAALKEKGPLRVACSGDTKEEPKIMIETFNKEFPGIVLDVVVDDPKYLDSAIDRTYRLTDGDDNGVDVAILQSIHDFPRWKHENRLMPYQVIPFDDIYPEFVDPHGAYTGCSLHTFGSIIYNPKFTDKSTLPTTYADFLVKPEWMDRLILAYPNDNDAMLYLFKLVTEKYGFKFIESLINTQQVHWVRGVDTPSLIIGQAETNSTENLRSVSFASGISSAPDFAFFAPEDTYMAWTKNAAIFATTRVPESAKLFMNFLLSDAWQESESRGKFSVRKAYDVGGIFRQKYVEPLGYGKFMADRAEVERWRMQFESLLGPPQGQDPVEIW